MAGTSTDKLALLKQTKADIKAAIREKGQAVADDEPFSSYAGKIRAIEGGGGGSGGGSGECSGEHIITVESLPEVGEEGAYYKENKFSDMVAFDGEQALLFKQMYEAYGMTVECYDVPTKPTENIKESNGQTVFHLYYVRDENDIFVYGDGEWISMSLMFKIQFNGEISNVSEASNVGYYALVGGELKQYTNGVYKSLIPKGDLIFTSNGDGTCYVSGIEPYSNENIVIPSVSPSGDTVTSIGDKAFVNCTAIRSVVIPETVTRIGEWAFENCTSLERMTVPDTVTFIGERAFKGCTELYYDFEIPKGLTSIEYSTFYLCDSLYSVRIPDGVTTIGGAAFYMCYYLTDGITIPDGVTTIEEYAFGECYNLLGVSLPNSITSIGNNVFEKCYSLTLSFRGTMAEWNAKGISVSVPSKEVVCTDGTVTL